MFRVLRRRLRAMRDSPSGQFASDIGRMIFEYRWISLAIVAVTVFQEVASLWPVNLLGRFIDGLGSPDTGRTVALLVGASVLATGCSTNRISAPGWR
jgi:hypothetical protein